MKVLVMGDPFILTVPEPHDIDNLLDEGVSVETTAHRVIFMTLLCIKPIRKKDNILPRITPTLYAYPYPSLRFSAIRRFLLMIFLWVPVSKS